MKVPSSIIEKLLQEKEFSRFDKTVDINNEQYHYFVNNSIFFSQMCRAYYLLAKELGIPSAEYDYVRKNGKNIILSKRICTPDEQLIEWDTIPEEYKGGDQLRTYHDYIQIWESIIGTFPFENKSKALDDLYKQWFFSLLIFDDDKQISIVKGKNGLYRLGEQFDYGGVYFSQEVNQLDNDIFYDEDEFQQFCEECIKDGEEPYTRERLDKDLDVVINAEVFEDIEWREGYDEALLKILPHLGLEFIAKCFSTNIIDVLDRDTEHEYSDNFKKVIFCMFETSKSVLKDKISTLPQIQKQTDSTKK